MTAADMISALTRAGFQNVKILSQREIIASAGDDFLLHARDTGHGWYTRIQDNYTGEVVTCVLDAEDEAVMAIHGLQEATPHATRISA